MIHLQTLCKRSLLLQPGKSLCGTGFYNGVHRITLLVCNFMLSIVYDSEYTTELSFCEHTHRTVHSFIHSPLRWSFRNFSSAGQVWIRGKCRATMSWEFNLRKNFNEPLFCICNDPWNLKMSGVLSIGVCQPNSVKFSLQVRISQLCVSL